METPRDTHDECERIVQIIPAPPNLVAVWKQDAGEFLYEPVICLALVESWLVDRRLDEDHWCRGMPEEDGALSLARHVRPLCLTEGRLELCDQGNYVGMEERGSQA